MLHWLLALGMLGILVYVTLAPFNPFIDFPLLVVASGVGIWAAKYLIKVAREVRSLRKPEEGGE